MTWISIFGVAIGVTSLIVVLSVMGGFAGDLKRKLLTGTPHIEITAQNKHAGFSLKKYPLTSFKERLAEAEKVQSYIKSDVVLKNDNKLATAQLFGVNPKEESHLWAFDQFMIDGDVESVGRDHKTTLDINGESFPGIILGSALAAKLGIDYGEKLTIVSPMTSVDILFSANTSFERHFVVAGIFNSNLFKYDQSWAVVSLDSARKFMVDYDPYLDEQEFVTGVAARITDVFQVDKFARSITEPKLKVRTWKDLNKSYLVALKLEKYSMSLVLGLIVLVAAFSISGTMAMTVFFRRGQIALMRSLGMTECNVLKLYLFQGLFIGFLGMIMGLIFGLLICFGIYYTDFISLPEGVYYLKKLPVKFLPYDYFFICFGALVLTLVAALFPSYLAAKQNASKGLRFL